MLKLSEFDYHLPAELIAQHPPRTRTDSRLLKVRAAGTLEDSALPDILDEFSPADVLVLNNTRVIPARVHGQKESGGRVEIMLERILGSRRCLAQIKASRAPKVGTNIFATSDASTEIQVVARHGSFFELRINAQGELIDWFKGVGHIPLPPYIERIPEHTDQDRYQTVYAQRDGAVAAPTAGLHFDDSLLSKIKNLGVELAEITLHVGAGTYQPVRSDSVDEHKMHQEWIEVSEDACQKINAARARGGRVFAVGTTVVRALETAAQKSPNRDLVPFSGDTDIFIYPGYSFKAVDRLLTNFHLPKSTLLMLVSAFSGKHAVFSAYEHAIAQEYRFFSYGDCMLLEAAPLEAAPLEAAPSAKT